MNALRRDLRPGDGRTRITLHVNGVANYIRGQAAEPLFDDTRTYWYADDPYTSVKTPGVGVTLRVAKQSKTLDDGQARHQ